MPKEHETVQTASLPVRTILADLLVGKWSAKDACQNRCVAECLQCLVQAINQTVEELQCVVLLTEVHWLTLQPAVVPFQHHSQHTFIIVIDLQTFNDNTATDNTRSRKVLVRVSSVQCRYSWAFCQIRYKKQQLNWNMPLADKSVATWLIE